jgi:ABC-type dipeptide/oligopeptide/nickel transport system ATPase component
VSAAIEVEGVTKRFGGTLAQNDVSFSVPQGDVLALLGPNGAGKTTLIRVLTTLLQADSGRALVAGLDVRKDARAIRSVIGLAGQYATVDELLTGRGEPRTHRAPLPPGQGPVPAAGAGRPGAHVAHRRRRRSGQDLLGRHAAAALWCAAIFAVFLAISLNLYRKATA